MQYTAEVIVILLFSVFYQSIHGISWGDYVATNAQNLTQSTGSFAQYFGPENVPAFVSLGNRKLRAVLDAVKFLDETMRKLPSSGSSHTAGGDCAIGDESQVFSTDFYGDGFCSQFQSLSKNFMYGLHYTNYSVPIIPQGAFVGYSFSDSCAFAGQSYHCYFSHLSPCQQQWETTPNKIVPFTPVDYRTADYGSNMIPVPFRPLGEAFWWGFMQFYVFAHMYRSILEDYIQRDALNDLRGLGAGILPAALLSPVPRIGIHVRHSDRWEKSDMKEEHHVHGLVEALEAMKESSDCVISGVHHHCFLPINFFDMPPAHSKDRHHRNWPTDSPGSLAFRVYLWLKEAQQGHIPLVARGNEHLFHRKDGTKAQATEVLVPMESVAKAVALYEATCAAAEIPHDTCRFPANDTWLAAQNERWLIPVQVFVVSDDTRVIQAAQSTYHLLTFASGFSQSADTMGTSQKLRRKSAMAHEEHPVRATLEILRDVYYLSRCSTIIGTASSQVYRMAVAVANATATLQDAIILDGDELDHVRAGVEAMYFPFPEEFHVVNVTSREDPTNLPPGTLPAGFRRFSSPTHKPPLNRNNNVPPPPVPPPRNPALHVHVPIPHATGAHHPVGSSLLTPSIKPPPSKLRSPATPAARHLPPTKPAPVLRQPHK